MSKHIQRQSTAPTEARTEVTLRPKMKGARELTENQRSELLSHLRAMVGDDTASLAEKIERAYGEAAWVRDAKEWMRERHRADRPKLRRHYALMSEQARELVRELDWEAPHGPMSPLTARDGYSVSWRPLRDLLLDLAAAADLEAAHINAPRGRPANAWRDELIRAVHAAYPQARKSRDSHFEHTIALLLCWLGEAVSDTHGVIMRALD